MNVNIQFIKIWRELWFVVFNTEVMFSFSIPWSNSLPIKIATQKFLCLWGLLFKGWVALHAHALNGTERFLVKQPLISLTQFKT
jgi:hypothetical protein